MGTNIYIRVGKQPGDRHTKSCTMKSKSDFRLGGIRTNYRNGEEIYD